MSESLTNDSWRVASRLALASVLMGALAACPGDPKPAEGIYAPMGEPIPSATPEQLETFARGEEVATRRFSPTDGLGPTFNVTFCAACHEKPVFGGAGAHYRDFLLVGQTFPDGSRVELGVNGVLDQFHVDGSRVPTPEGANHFATRNPIPFFGVGLIAELPDEAILANADPADRDGDGISGRPNYERGFVARFGRKSQTLSIEGFLRGPLFNHLGITTDPLPPELAAALPVPVEIVEEPASRGDALIGRRSDAQATIPPGVRTTDDDGVPDPELSVEDLYDLVSWAMLLAPPEPDEPTAETEAGHLLFEEANCSGCHVESLKGPRGLIFPYSDFLIHDMGPELADGILMLDATGSEFRTQPLWGVSPVGPYLHDGRADSLDDAIRMHGGEAQAAADAYAAMSETERGQLVAFLESLGGADQHSDGLLPPDAAVPPAGEYGGPRRELTADEMAEYELGRAVFDRDFPITEGLGPSFNGDSCRACHFDPVIGGAGPSDVDVSRHGSIVDGVFEIPSTGTTMAHRHALDSVRPAFDADTNVTELRQTPTTLGLGAIDDIPESVILANEDPNDLDADGISGRAHILGDGRLGRFGWKANVPSVIEFVRDGLTNEMGVTLPPQEGLTFGATSDDDEWADPEIDLASMEALGFFIAMQAPPPRAHENPTMEDVGEATFGTIGCTDCHMVLEDSSGAPVPLYSDILLHDVAEEGAFGIADGDAGFREFRTAPLWGLATSAPYMHDGRAETIEEAIAAHAGEALGSRQAYEALDASAREALIAFLRSL